MKVYCSPEFEKLSPEERDLVASIVRSMRRLKLRRIEYAGYVIEQKD